MIGHILIIVNDNRAFRTHNDQVGLVDEGEEGVDCG